MRLAADAVVVARGGKRILDSVSVLFDSPGLVAVIGPNGAGKSTALLALAGLLKAESGAISLDGAPVREIDRKVLARRRAYLPQNARCEWPITVENAVAIGLTPNAPAFGDLAPADRARIAETLVACDLEDKRDQTITTLSGGELARAMLARALVGDPEILFADEPIAGLDPRHALDAMKRLRALADRGRLVIVALHDLALAVRFADRIIALRDGRVLADGPTEAVMTPALLLELFDVTARVERDADGVGIRVVDAA
jgi:iron complex transport system ATP-binding protein